MPLCAWDQPQLRLSVDTSRTSGIGSTSGVGGVGGAGDIENGPPLEEMEYTTMPLIAKKLASRWQKME